MIAISSQSQGSGRDRPGRLLGSRPSAISPDRAQWMESRPSWAPSSRRETEVLLMPAGVESRILDSLDRFPLHRSANESLALAKEELPVLNGDSRVERSQQDQLVTELVLVTCGDARVII